MAYPEHKAYIYYMFYVQDKNSKHVGAGFNPCPSKGYKALRALKEERLWRMHLMH